MALIVPSINGAVPSIDGSAPVRIISKRAGESGVYKMTVMCNTEGYERTAPTIVESGSDRVRLSLTEGGIASAVWGNSVTINEPVNNTGVDVWFMARDYSDSQPFDGVNRVIVPLIGGLVRLPQDNIVPVSGEPSIRDAAGIVAVVSGFIASAERVSQTSQVYDASGIIATTSAITGSVNLITNASGIIPSSSSLVGTAERVASSSSSVSGTLYPHGNGSLNTTAHNVTDTVYAPGAGTAGEAVRFRWGSASWQTLISQYGEGEAIKAKSVGVPPSGASSFSVQVGSGTVVTFTLALGTFDTSKSGTLNFYYESYDFYDEGSEQQVTGTNALFCSEGVISNGRLVLV